MDLLQTVRKEGSRGGRGDFKWEDVKQDQHRENYLGHSVMAPVGRWQKGRDLDWYSKGEGDNSDAKSIADARAEEVRKIKELEEDARATALGLAPPVRDGEQENPNLIDLGEQPRQAGNTENERDDSNRRKRRHSRERDERRRRRHRSRDRDGERRKRKRSRSRSPQRSSKHDDPRARSKDHDRPRYRSRSREHRDNHRQRSHHTAEGRLRSRSPPTRHERREPRRSRAKDGSRSRSPQAAEDRYR